MIPTVAFIHPSAEDWAPSDLIRDVLDLRQAAVANGSTGPWILLLNVYWTPFLTCPYAEEAMPDKPLAHRLVEIEGIHGIITTPMTRPEACAYLMNIAAAGET